MPPLQHLTNPEYLHTLINPVPVYGLSMGVLAMIIALIMRSRAAMIAGLALILVAGISAWPTYALGERAYDRVIAMSDADGAAWLDAHMARAENLIYLFYAVAALAVAAMLAPLKWARSSTPLAITTLVVAIGTLGAGGFIAYAGGHVRHKEFRFEEPPARKQPMHHHNEGEEEKESAGHNDATAPPHQHGAAGEMEHGKMGSPAPAGAQSPMAHDMAMSPAPQTPDQVEAARKQLEASRLQLEASRKQLEATEAAKAQAPAAAQSPSSTPSPGEEHQHDHP